MEYINLSNIKITQNNIKFEFLYKSNTTTNNIYFKDQIIININVTYYNAIIR